MSVSHLTPSGRFNFSRMRGISPDSIVAGTHKKIWWICRECQNEWFAAVVNRSRSGAGCPSCSGRTVHSDGRNSMRKTHPELAEEFHPTKNGDATPDNLKAGTNKKLHWICKTCSYEWITSGNKRVSDGTGCPCCRNFVVHSDGRNSMRATHPEFSRISSHEKRYLDS